jgi:chromosome segregation ATPase
MSVSGNRENVCATIDQLDGAQRDFTTAGNLIEEAKVQTGQVRKDGRAAEGHIRKIEEGLADVLNHLTQLVEVTREGSEASAVANHKVVEAGTNIEASQDKLDAARRTSIAALGSQRTTSLWVTYPSSIESVPADLLRAIGHWRERSEAWREGFGALHTQAGELLDQLRTAGAAATELPSVMENMKRPNLRDVEVVGILADNATIAGRTCGQISNSYKKIAEDML